MKNNPTKSAVPNPARAFLGRIESRSSVIEKTDPDLRRRLDQAIADRAPATYKEIYQHFDLAGRGISFTAFYYYARRIRITTALMELPHLAAPPDTDDDGRVKNPAAESDRLIGAVLADCLLDTALSPDADPRNVERIARAYHAVARLELARRRLSEQFDDLKRRERIKDTDNLIHAANQIARHRAAYNAECKEHEEARARDRLAEAKKNAAETIARAKAYAARTTSPVPTGTEDMYEAIARLKSRSIHDPPIVTLPRQPADQHPPDEPADQHVPP